MANPSTTSSSNRAASFFFLRFGGGGLCAFSLTDISSSSPLSSSCFLACIRWARSRRLLRLIRCCFISVSMISRHVNRLAYNKLQPVTNQKAWHREWEKKTNEQNCKSFLSHRSDEYNITQTQRKIHGKLKEIKLHTRFMNSQILIKQITIIVVIINAITDPGPVCYRTI